MKRVLSHEVSGRKVNIGEGGSQEVAPTPRRPGGAARERGAPLGCPDPWWALSGGFLCLLVSSG